MPPIPLFLAGFALGVWWNQQRPWPLYAAEDAFGVLFIAGLLLVTSGIAVFASGLVTFARARTGILLRRAATNVVSTGPYRWSRNPMYVSFVALYVGASLVANTLWPLLLLPIVILALNRFVIAREERYMRQEFDDRYEDYARRVPRWL